MESRNLDEALGNAFFAQEQEEAKSREIENLINKNVYPTDKEDLKVEEDKGSALSSLGLKPKIVH